MCNQRTATSTETVTASGDVAAEKTRETKEETSTSGAPAAAGAEAKLSLRTQAALAWAASMALCGVPWILTALAAPDRFAPERFPVPGLRGELWASPWHWAILIGVAVLFEPVTFLIHKHVMHGSLWWVHEDHHHDTAYTRPELYKNDFFPLVFAVPCSSVACWVSIGLFPRFAASAIIGALAYGTAYMYVHEEVFHRRFGLPFTAAVRKHPYMKRLSTAHGLHHSRKMPGLADVAFGFLYAPPRFEADKVRKMKAMGEQEETLWSYYGPLFGYPLACDQ